MSHIVRIKGQFQNKDALIAAFTKLGWTVVQNQTIRTSQSWDAAGGKIIYEYVAKNPTGGYDVGFNVDQSPIDLNCNFDDASIKKQLGDNFSELKKNYHLSLLEQEYGELEVIKNPNGSWEIIKNE